ncbi:MAG: MFS transporter [Syntrophales bacterium]|jgi:MFS transporter, ACS family, hexuronate transporter
MLNDKLRWKIIMWFFLVVMISYMDRINLAVAAPLILKEFKLSPSELGIVLSGFQIGYMVLMFFGGFIAQRFSARKVVTVILILWSITTFLTGFSFNFLTIFLARLIFGMAEGPMFPSINYVVNNWTLNKEKGFAGSAYTSALPIGVVLGTLASAYLVTEFGWRSVFYVFGGAGIVIGIISWFVVRDTPREHPSVTPAELKLIEADYHVSTTGSAKGMTMGQMLKDPTLLLFGALDLFYSFLFWADLNWLPTYFVMARKVTLLKSGLLSAIPWFAAFLGMVIIGRLSDTGKRYKANWCAGVLIVCAPFTAYAVITPDTYVSLACFSVSLFCIGAVMSVSSVLVWELWDRADVAKAFGMIVTMLSLGGILGPSMVGYILETTNSFNVAYYIMAVFALISATFFLILYGREKKVRALRESLKQKAVPDPVIAVAEDAV